jgi:hypothetical protein
VRPKYTEDGAGLRSAVSRFGYAVNDKENEHNLERGLRILNGIKSLCLHGRVQKNGLLSLEGFKSPTCF